MLEIAAHIFMAKYFILFYLKKIMDNNGDFPVVTTVFILDY